MFKEPDSTASVLLEVGRIGRPHGLNGDLLVSLSTDRTERLKTGSVLSVEGKKLSVKASRIHLKKFIVHFDGIDTRDEAEQLSGQFLFAEPIQDDTLWVHELIGSKVIDQFGNDRGVVKSVIENPASDLLETENGDLIPLTFLSSHEPKKVIYVSVPDGLFLDEDELKKGSNNNES